MASSEEDQDELLDELPQSVKRPEGNKRRISLAADVTAPEGKRLPGVAGERRLSLKAANARASVQLWLMSNVPELMGLSDTESLPAAIQVDGQDAFLSRVVDGDSTPTEENVLQAIQEAFGNDGAGRPNWESFQKDLCEKVLGVFSAYQEARSQSKSLPGAIASTTEVCNTA